MAHYNREFGGNVMFSFVKRRLVAMLCRNNSRNYNTRHFFVTVVIIIVRTVSRKCVFLCNNGSCI